MGKSFNAQRWAEVEKKALERRQFMIEVEPGTEAKPKNPVERVFAPAFAACAGTPEAPPPAKITELEKKAIDVTTQDIKTYQPEIYKQLAAELSQVNQAQQLNSKLIELASVKAPAAPPKRRKPRITELKETDDADLYDKYFKMER